MFVLNSQVEIFYAETYEIGYGHTRRCTTLVEELQLRNISVSLNKLSVGEGNISDLFDHTDSIKRLVVFDSPLEINSLIQQSLQANMTTVTLDYFGSCTPDINIVVYAHSPFNGVRMYEGLAFHMIRSEILKLPPCNVGEGVLISIGGGDIHQDGGIAARLVQQIGEHPTLIKGPLTLQDQSHRNYPVFNMPSDYGERLCESKWVITNGGGCLFESMYLGKAAVVLPQTSKELTIARKFLAVGAILGIGFDAIQHYEDRVIIDTGKIAKGIIDGLGAKRVSDIIIDEL